MLSAGAYSNMLLCVLARGRADKVDSPTSTRLPDLLPGHLERPERDRPAVRLSFTILEDRERIQDLGCLTYA